MTDHHHAAGEQVQQKVSNGAFLDVVFGADAGRVHVTAFASDPTRDTRDARQRWAGNLAHRILDTFRSNENTYFVVSIFDQDYVDERAGRARRRKEQFRSMHVVVVDDVGPKVDADLIREKMGAPTYRLETSPGNEQWGYVLREPLRSRHAAEALVAGMIARGLTADGKDPGMAGVTRYVRLPVGRNTKAAFGPQGFDCRLLEWNPERWFSAQAIADAWGIDLAGAERVAREDEESWRMRRKDRQQARVVADWDSRWAHILPAQDSPHAACFDAEDMEGDEIRGGEDDLLFLGVQRLRLVKQRSGYRRWEITCPFVHLHTRRADNGTAFMPNGGIACHHGHCVGRTRAAYKVEVAKQLRALGDPDAVALADRLATRRGPKPGVRLDPDHWSGIAAAIRKFETARTHEGDEQRALFALGATVARYVAAGRVSRDIAATEVERRLQRCGVAAAAWRAALAWGIEKVSEEDSAKGAV